MSLGACFKKIHLVNLSL